MMLDNVYAHADTMEARQYANHEDLLRDMATGIELAQQFLDSLTELIEETEDRIADITVYTPHIP